MVTSVTISKDSPLRDSLSHSLSLPSQSMLLCVRSSNSSSFWYAKTLSREDTEDGDVDADKPKQNVNILFVNKSCEQDETCHVLAVKNKKHVFITSDSALELLLLARLHFWGKVFIKV